MEPEGNSNIRKFRERNEYLKGEQYISECEELSTFGVNINYVMGHFEIRNVK